MSGSEHFSFKEIDEEGMETLEAIAEASAFNEWMYQRVCARLEGQILEIGSGIGNISECFLRDGRTITLSDIRENYCSYLGKKFADSPSLQGISLLDLTHPDFDQIYQKYLGQYDGLFALNVVEHIQDDGLALANARKLLRKGGRLVILVPAYQTLYNNFDTALEHYRRYTKSSLSRLFKENDLTIQQSFYFNIAGIPGWFIFGRLLGRKIIPNGPMKIYNSLVPLFKLVDWMCFRKFGLSVVVEGVK